jgi:Protein of unknown function (DUF3108)
MLANAELLQHGKWRRARALAGIAVLALVLHASLLGGVRWERFGLPQAPAPAVMQVRSIVPTLPTAAQEQAPAAAQPAEATAPPRVVRAAPPSPRAPAPPPAAPAAIDPLPPAAPPRAADEAVPAPEQPPVAERAAPGEAATQPLAGLGGDAPAPRTLVPASVRIDYTLLRGEQRGTGSLDWSAGVEQYALQLQAQFDGATVLAQQSSGGFDVDGLAPQRFTDERARRDTMAVNFQREAGKISFSGPSIALPLVAGAQDRLSALLQLAAVVAAEPAARQEGGAVTLYVVGVRADASPWVFNFVGEETVQTGQGAVPALKFVRTAAGPYDSQVEVWLDPSRQSMPVRWRTANGPDDPGMDWVMEQATLAAQP